MSNYEPNPVLMQIYGEDLTDGRTEAEKIAADQADFVANLLQEQGYDLEKLTMDDVIKTASYLGMDELVKQAMADGSCESGAGSEAPGGAPSSEEKKKKDEEEAEDRVKQAEIAGQIMAHSFARELRNMPEEMFGKEASAGSAIKGALGKLKGAAGKAHNKVLNMGASLTPQGLSSAASARGGAAADKLTQGMSAAQQGASRLEGSQRSLNRLHGAAGYGALGAGAGAAAAGGAAMAGRKKESQFIDTLAEKRAYDILVANGVDPSTLEQPAPSPEADVSTKLAADVDARAIEILAEYGFSVSKD